MPLFSEGFLGYFTSGQFCDMTLVVRNKEYKTHRVILVYSSGYFAQQLSNPKYAKFKYVHFVLKDIQDPSDLFPAILRYVYEGRVTITEENCVPMLTLAKFLEIEDLKKRIATFLSTCINRKNAIIVLQRALEFNAEDVKTRCLLVLARNFSRIATNEPFETNQNTSTLSARSNLRSGSYAPTTVIGFTAYQNTTPQSTLSSMSAPTLRDQIPQSNRTHRRGGSGERSVAAPTSTSPTSAANTPLTQGISTSPSSVVTVGSAGNAMVSPIVSSPTATTWSKATTPWGTAANAIGSNSTIGAYTEQESPFKCLPIGLMLTLLGHVGLAVMNEYLVYKSVCDYIKANDDELTKEDRINLFEKVRFPFLNYAQLQDVMKNPQVPQHLLAEALIIRLGNFEAPQIQRTDLRTSHQKRTTCGLFFEYTSDFDDKGLLNWIATQGHTAEWVNPINRGVKVTASSMEKGLPSDVLELKPSECWTKDVPSSWFAFDLGKNRQFLLTFYTLRHGSSSRQDCLRNWVLQVSDDGTEWETIKRHVNEVVLNATFATASWEVMCINPHRYFRVLQTGHNSTNKNFFSLSGIELYGDFYQTG